MIVQINDNTIINTNNIYIIRKDELSKDNKYFKTHLLKINSQCLYYETSKERDKDFDLIVSLMKGKKAPLNFESNDNYFKREYLGTIQSNSKVMDIINKNNIDIYKDTVIVVFKDGIHSPKSYLIGKIDCIGPNWIIIKTKIHKNETIPFEYIRDIQKYEEYTNRSAKDIIEEKGKLINERTNKIVIAGIKKIKDNSNKFEFYITSKETPKYKYRVFFFEYGIEQYPIKITLEEDIDSEINKERDHKTYEIENEEELTDMLGKVLNSKKINNVIEGLIQMNNK